MRSAARGKRTSQAEVTNISANGFWLLLADREVFVPFKSFPWFRAAAIAQLLNVKWPSPHHLYWPDLDVDLATESIDHPERYPLISVGRPSTALREPAPRIKKPRGKRARRAAPTRRKPRGDS